MNTPSKSPLTSKLSIKVMVILSLSVVLLLPVSALNDLISERQDRAGMVKQDIARQWGTDTRLIGPFLVVPRVGFQQFFYIQPQEQKTILKAPVTERYKGIFKIPTYTIEVNTQGTIVMRGRPQNTGETSDLLWEQAVLILAVEKSGHIDTRSEAGWRGESLTVQRGSNRFGIEGSFLYAQVPALTMNGPEASFSTRLSVRGTGSFGWVPLAQDNTVQATSNWQHPNFGGEQLPYERDIGRDGFSATWRMRNAMPFGPDAQYTYAEMPPEFHQSSSLEIAFGAGVSHYQMVSRGSKYAFLVITLIFATFFIFEITTGLNLHWIQYMLVGCALALFYGLLLSLSEHISFSWAYLCAATPTVVLISFYTKAILATTFRALICGGSLGAVYGILFIILKQEKFALLTGFWALFAVLAVVMFVTRKVNWSALNSSSRAHG